MPLFVSPFVVPATQDSQSRRLGVTLAYLHFPQPVLNQITSPSTFKFLLQLLGRGAYTCHCAYEEVRGLLAGIGSFLPLHEVGA